MTRSFSSTFPTWRLLIRKVLMGSIQVSTGSNGSLGPRIHANQREFKIEKLGGLSAERFCVKLLQFHPRDLLSWLSLRIINANYSRLTATLRNSKRRLFPRLLMLKRLPSLCTAYITARL